MLISCIVLAAAIVSEPSAAHGVSGVQPSPDSEQGFLPLIDRSLESWERVQLPRNAASIRDGSLLMTGAPGWLRTRKPFSDFVLRFESRFKDPSATFSILLRAVDATRHSPVPANGYAVRIEAGGPQGPPRATVVAFSQQGAPREFPFTRNGLAERLTAYDQWQAMELSCAGANCSLLVNGGAAAAMTALEIPVGYIGLSVSSSTVEFRNLRVRRTPPIKEGFACLVNPDGEVTEVMLLRSLDRQSGLDREAVAAAKQWRFTPTTLRGQPVQIVVTLELTFRIGR